MQCAGACVCVRECKGESESESVLHAYHCLTGYCSSGPLKKVLVRLRTFIPGGTTEAAISTIDDWCKQKQICIARLKLDIFTLFEKSCTDDCC